MKRLIVGLLLLAPVLTLGAPDGSKPTDAQRELDRFAAIFQKTRGADLPAEPDEAKYLVLFKDVVERVRNDYVTPIDDRTLIDAAISGLKREPVGSSAEDLIEAALKQMITSLDPYSNYQTAKEFKDMQVVYRAGAASIGVLVMMDQAGALLVEVYPDLPAAQSGLKAGDHIVEIDGASVHDLKAQEVLDKLKGAAGGEVRLRVLPSGQEKPVSLTITRAIVKIDPVVSERNGSVVYIRVREFVVNTISQLQAAVRKSRAKMEEAPAGYVLDLRNDPGGLFDGAVGAASVFLKSGTPVVSTRARKLENLQRYSTHGEDFSGGAPLVVLVNRATAGSAEIVAAALQDSGRAKVIGEPTFRYGRLQTIMPLPPYGALRLSTAIIERPSGRKLGDGGVTPDLEVAWTPPSADSGLLNSFGDPAFDAPYAAALRFLDEEIKLSATPPRTP